MAIRSTAAVEPSGTGQIRAVVAAFYAGLVVIVIAALLASRASSQALAEKSAPTPHVASLNGVPNGVLYHDPHKLFTVVIPKSWKASIETGGGTAGSTSGSFT